MGAAIALCAMLGLLRDRFKPNVARSESLMRCVRLIGVIGMIALGAQPVAFGQSASDPAGDWSGSYTCVQGSTALHLSIKPEANGRFGALFRFGALPSNPSVPEGCFLMTGAFNPKTRRLTLSPGRWLLQPYGFVTVGLDGVLNPSGSRFKGKVTGGTQCTTFDLSRRASGQSDNGPCRTEPALVVAR
jgi:hypothetical protein